MSSRSLVSLVFAVVSLALAACNNAYNPNYLYGTPTPSPTATAPTTPNPAITDATVSVEYSSAPINNEPVTLSTYVNGGAGPAIKTQNTNTNGATTFTGLTGAANYCFSATYTPPVSGALAQTQSYCGDLWQTGITLNF
jgi:hypothetical protein